MVYASMDLERVTFGWPTVYATAVPPDDDDADDDDDDEPITAQAPAL